MQFYHYHIGAEGQGVKIQQGHHNRIPATTKISSRVWNKKSSPGEREREREDLRGQILM